MNTRTAAPVILTVSLVVLMSGCAGAAAQGGQVRDDLRPAANAAAAIGIARGEVIVREDLSPTRVQNRITAQMAEQAVQRSAREISADARRELHSQAAPVDVATAFSADALRELHSQPVEQASVVWSPDARRELHAGQPVTTTAEPSFSAAAMRELKGSAPVEVEDDLSPLGDGTPTEEPTDTVDDDLSPNGDSH